MPNIPGLGLIIALLFAPQTEIRRNKELTRYINVLCGMGFDPDTKAPYFAEHDTVFNIDINLDLEDFQWINHLRYIMSQLIFLQPLMIKPEVNEISKGQLKLKVKEIISK